MSNDDIEKKTESNGAFLKRRWRGRV